MFKDKNPLNVLKDCGGCYESPRDGTSKILGPLVAYAGKYKTADGQEKQWVGPEYFNFARAEELPEVRDYFADIIVTKSARIFMADPTLVAGMPMGGVFLAVEIGNVFGCRTIFAEKKVVALADPSKGLKEKSELIIERHEIHRGDKVAIVEDVCNNFSTTEKAHDLIIKAGAEFLGILCALNRSETEKWHDFPVISAIFRPSEQYRQEDPAVSNLIAEGKIAWKPKQQWEMLKAAMQR